MKEKEHVEVKKMQSDRVARGLVLEDEEFEAKEWKVYDSKRQVLMTEEFCLSEERQTWTEQQAQRAGVVQGPSQKETESKIEPEKNCTSAEEPPGKG